MNNRINLIAIFTIMFACVSHVNTLSLITTANAIQFAQNEPSQDSLFPTFDASDNVLETATQKAQTALADGQLEKALVFANQALDHVKSYYHMNSEVRINIHQLFVNIYVKQNNYAAAEKHFQQAYQIQKKVFGERHEQTMDLLAKLGTFYQKWGKREKAEKTLQLINTLYQKIFGINHKKTLASIDQLAKFYLNDLAYEKAKPYVAQAVKINTNLFGRHSKKNIASLFQAAKTYYHCKSYDRALKSFELALSFIKKNGGKPFDIQLDILQYLAKLNIMNKHFQKAEHLYQKALVLSRQIHGAQNTLQLTFNHKLIEIYKLQGQHEKVRRQLQKIIELTSQISGKNHPKTITSQKALADFLFDQKEYTQAAPIYEKVLDMCKKQYGTHEKTISLTKRLAETYIAQSQYNAAEALLKNHVKMYSGILQSTRDNLQYLAHIYKQQNNCTEAIPLMDQVFRLNESTLGPSHPKTLHSLSELIGCLEAENQRIEALNLLKRIEPDLYKAQWEKLRKPNMPVSDQTECILNAQTFCHAVCTLAREMTDPEVISYIADVMLRWQYLEHFPGAANKELPGYHDINKLFQRRMVNLPYRLPRNSAFIHLFPYDVIDFSSAQSSQTRWMGILILSEHENTTNMFSNDLGVVHDTQQLILDLMREKRPEHKTRIEQQLYKQLLGDFETHIHLVQSVYISTNGLGQMIPFSRLKLSDGQYWIMRQPVCRIFSALDFMKNITPVYTGSLLAVGHVNYDAFSQTNSETLNEKEGYNTKKAANHIPLPVGNQAGFKYRTIPDELQMIENIVTVYSASRRASPVFWSDTQATESALKQLAYPPRILHMSVDCFYLTQSVDKYSAIRGGLALAGANQGFQRQIGPDGQDGLLLDHEILSLNLNGTELVCLTHKCDSQKMGIHNSAYFQMAAAFHMAGCRFVLSPIWKTKHADASKFVVKFYENWLRQSISNPSKALITTQRQCISKGDSPDVWGSFVLMGF
jgi:tetratricopeptide (TPR) repeat protein/CHAT domain-containing protein